MQMVDHPLHARPVVLLDIDGAATLVIIEVQCARLSSCLHHGMIRCAAIVIFRIVRVVDLGVLAGSRQLVVMFILMLVVYLDEVVAGVVGTHILIP